MPARRYRARRGSRRRSFRRKLTRRSRRATRSYGRRSNSNQFRPMRRINPSNLGRALTTGGEMLMIHTTKLQQYQFATDTDTAPAAGQIASCAFRPDSMRHPFGPSESWQDNQLSLAGSATPSSQFSGEISMLGFSRFADSFDRWKPKWAKISFRITNKQLFPIVVGVLRHLSTVNEDSNNFGGVEPVPLQSGTSAFSLPKTQRHRIGAYDITKNERLYSKVFTVFCPIISDWKRMEPHGSMSSMRGVTALTEGGISDPQDTYKVYVTVQPANLTDLLTAVSVDTNNYRYSLVDISAEVSQAILYSDPK